MSGGEALRFVLSSQLSVQSPPVVGNNDIHLFSSVDQGAGRRVGVEDERNTNLNRCTETRPTRSLLSLSLTLASNYLRFKA